MPTVPNSPEDSTRDSGLLELYDPERDTVQRIELEDLALGEIWGIGSSTQCRIALPEEGPAREYAILTMTSQGPLVTSRAEALWRDGRKIQQHLFYDGDHLYLGRIVLYYHNFFRQRNVLEGGTNENVD